MKLQSLLVASVLGFGIAAAPAAPLGTSFTYQGRLTDGATPANGTYLMLFELYDSMDGGTRVGTPMGTNTVAVANGLFAVDLDFGAGAFAGDARWLQIVVSTNGGFGLPVLLSPRTRVAPAPHAIHALTAGSVASIGNGMIGAPSLATTGVPAAGQVLAYNGSSLTWQVPGTPGNSWGLTGNNAAEESFLGTLNNLPLELRANNSRVLRLEPNAYGPNVIGGSARNFVASGVEGATIAGGGTLTRFGGIYTNAIAGDYATIGGGLGNRIAVNGFDSTISGGRENVLQFGAYRSTIGGGIANTIASNAYESTISGGSQNSAESNEATVGGGQFNHARGSSSTIGGGYGNTAIGGAATVAGGSQNAVEGDEAIVGGGYQNIIGPGSSDATISGGRRNQIQTNAYNSSIGGGNFNRINTSDSAIAGGVQNQIQSGAYSSVIAGGTANTVTSNAFASSIGGGSLNAASGIYATIPGGFHNEAAGSYSFAAGSQAKARQPGAFVWADSQGYDFGADSVANSVNFRCLGGVRFSSGSFLGINQNVSWTPGNATWSYSSDRNLKDRLQAVNPEAILAKVSRLSISEWSYKGYPQRHIGPMAQDFHALFPLNDDDKALNEADLHGVTLAAIQGLNQKLEEALKEKDARIAMLEKQVAGLKSAQLQASAEWDARFGMLQKAVARMADTSATALAVNPQTTEAR